MSKIVFDANAILRFIIQDNLEQANATEKVLLADKGYIPLEVISEVVFVLQKVYRVERSIIAKKLKDIIRIRDGLVFEKDIVSLATDIYLSYSLDFVDCLLAGYFKIKDYSVFTFDKNLQKKIRNL